MTTHETGTDHRPAGLAARALVAAGLAAVTWLVALVAVGVVAEMDTSSALGVLPLFVVALMAAPLYAVAPWRPEPGGRVVAWIRANRTAIGLAVGLLLVRAVPVAPGVLVGLLDLPFRSAGLLFGAELFYRRLIGPAAGEFLRSFAQWYLEALWVLVIGGILADAAEWLAGWVR